VTEQLLDVKAVLHLIWRHRGLVSIFLVLGLIGSAFFVFVKPPLYSASSLVLLPGSSNSNGQSVGDDMSTDSQIATSAEILNPVGARVDPSLSLITLRQRIHASGTATNVLQITALGTSAAQAEALTNTDAAKLVHFVTTNGSSTDASGLAALQAEATQLTKQVNDVNGEVVSITSRIDSVGASSAAGQQDTALLAALTAQQSQSTLQLDSINSEIAVDQLGASAANAGTEVIQKATVAIGPSVFGRALAIGLGGLIGLAVGSVFVVFLYRGDRRLRKRDQIAEAVGVPVMLSFNTGHRSKVGDWMEFFDKYESSSNDRWRVRQALSDLDLHEQRGSLIVLALTNDVGSLAAAPQLAMSAASLGMSVSLNVIGTDHRAMDLRVAMERLAMSGQEFRPHLQLQGGTNPVGLTVTSIVVDPQSLEMLLLPSGRTLLAVSAGFATVEDLARVAISAADSRQTIVGIVVTNPDPDDLTTGRLVDVATRPARSQYRSGVPAGRG
jgi:capsular polysaccharide biosynthesis protein